MLNYTLQAYEPLVFNMHHQRIILHHWEIFKSTIVIDLHISFNDARRLMRTHMMIVMDFNPETSKLSTNRWFESSSALCEG